MAGTSYNYTNSLSSSGVNYFNNNSNSSNISAGNSSPSGYFGNIINGGFNDKQNPGEPGQGVGTDVGGGVGYAIGSIWGMGPVGAAAGEDAGTLSENIYNGNWSNAGTDFMTDLNPSHLQNKQYGLGGGSGGLLSGFTGGGMFGGLGGSSGGQSGSSSDSGSSFWTDLFLRTVIIILGFIFVAVGLTMFKGERSGA